MLSGIVTEGIYELLSQYLQIKLAFNVKDMVRPSLLPTWHALVAWMVMHLCCKLVAALLSPLGSGAAPCQLQISCHSHACHWACSGLHADICPAYACCIVACSVLNDQQPCSHLLAAILLQSHLYTALGATGMAINSLLLRALICVMGETNMLRFGVFPAHGLLTRFMLGGMLDAKRTCCICRATTAVQPHSSSYSVPASWHSALHDERNSEHRRDGGCLCCKQSPSPGVWRFGASSPCLWLHLSAVGSFSCYEVELRS